MSSPRESSIARNLERDTSVSVSAFSMRRANASVRARPFAHAFSISGNNVLITSRPLNARQVRQVPSLVYTTAIKRLIIITSVVRAPARQLRAAITAAIIARDVIAGDDTRSTWSPESHREYRNRRAEIQSPSQLAELIRGAIRRSGRFFFHLPGRRTQPRERETFARGREYSRGQGLRECATYPEINVSDRDAKWWRTDVPRNTLYKTGGGGGEGERGGQAYRPRDEKKKEGRRWKVNWIRAAYK